MVLMIKMMMRVAKRTTMTVAMMTMRVTIMMMAVAKMTMMTGAMMMIQEIVIFMTPNNHILKDP